MDYRDQLDRLAHVHGYEEREDEPNCSDCIHQPMCSGENCHFDRKWYPEDLEKKYYRTNDFDERMDETLYSLRDLAEMGWTSTDDCQFHMEQSEWKREHPKKEFCVRIEIKTSVEARDEMEARRLACEEYILRENEPGVDANTIREYRMPVRYNCCETGYEYGYEYIYAKSEEEAKFLFRNRWIPDIEAEPDFEHIEESNEDGGYDE